ncbi:putative LRR receptor-like serine/threonine-protein kinase isoform X3 [Gossypium australe]|uniref:Putative LRR receptor-like serine/threonine-protein kinase isoform X3 n=1 Tax=Gossypium australe TaxID=47621 RepID=A0A5B6WJG3_9ROSI|nr:putative LRR receptor-like serine/threonine-protein kinase isoform X3 [Gossypium australe]
MHFYNICCYVHAQVFLMRLSKNNLSGPIPRHVANLTGLSFLYIPVMDLSYNNLSGPTPKILAKGYSITGNNFLCASSEHICTDVSYPLNGMLLKSIKVLLLYVF